MSLEESRIKWLMNVIDKVSNIIYDLSDKMNNAKTYSFNLKKELRLFDFELSLLEYKRKLDLIWKIRFATLTVLSVISLCWMFWSETI